jgi:hypothetical protein
MNLTVRQTPFAELIGAPTFDALIERIRLLLCD